MTIAERRERIKALVKDGFIICSYDASTSEHVSGVYLYDGLHSYNMQHVEDVDEMSDEIIASIVSVTAWRDCAYGYEEVCVTRRVDE